MGASWKLGRVAGIDVFLHPTFLLILFLPGVAENGVYGLGLVLAGFGCVLMHEFGHALAARRFGIDTANITLYPIGGVARLDRMPKSPVAELVIALAGPAVNVAVALGLVGAALLGVFRVPDVGPFLASLLAINVMLAVFNMVPAFPMDGGRVLRALLTGWLGRLRATEVAAGLGRLLAVAFGVYSLVNGAWSQVFLAAFIYMMAGLELASVAAEDGRDRPQRGSKVWDSPPPGARWVQTGRGIWQLAPILVDPRDGSGRRWR